MTKAPFLILLSAMALWCSPSRAYITSAQLEYSVDDFAVITLNGRRVLERSGRHWADYAVLSTSDGTLPLETFNLNGENLLAIRAINVDGLMDMSYRLTVHHSSGDPVVIWGDPESTRFMHLPAGQTPPPGWDGPGFDDSKWEHPVPVANVRSNYYQLFEPALAGFFGTASVPHLSHRTSAEAGKGEHGLFRSRFRFPYTPAKTTLMVNPAQAPRAGKVAIRVVPGADCADLGPFKLFADLPAGLDLLQAPPAAIYDPVKRRLEWSLSAADQVRYVRLPIASIIKASGWERPEKAIPNPKAQISKGSLNEFLFPLGWPGGSAQFLPGFQGSFKFAAPPAGVATGFPRILGVIFHNQLLSGASNGSGEDVDRIHFNYSTRPDQARALAHDAIVSRVGASNNWYDGYYDATEDRAWTWQDLDSMSLFIASQTMMRRDKAQLADAWVIVKCMQPASLSPIFYAQVKTANCETLALQAGIVSPRFPGAMDSAILIANPQGCPPPSAPSPTPLPATAVLRAPPVPNPSAPGGIRLGCLQSFPEPFHEGGVFVAFCLERPASVRLELYPENGGNALRILEAGEFRKGDSQLFFNGLDGQGKPLKPGRYLYKVVAREGGLLKEQNSWFHKAAGRR